MKMLTAEGLQKLLQKVKTVFATKTEVNTIVNDLQSPSSTTGQSFVHTSGNETIAGTKTFSSIISGSINGSSSSCTGNTATATKLKTARTINGVSFDGSANITVADSTKLPLAGGSMTGDLKITTSTMNQIRLIQGNYGVLLRNDGSNFYLLQTASGSATDGSWNSARPLTVNLSSGVCTINGNAATSTKLATARTINGVSFDGSANITVADSTKVAKAGDTMTGTLTIKPAGPGLKLCNNVVTKGTNPSSNTWTYLELLDNANGRLGWIGNSYNTSGVTTVGMYVRKQDATTENSIGVGYDVNKAAYTWAPTPATTDNSTKIATTAFVKAQGYITSSGSITGSSGSCTGNAATATKIHRAPGGSTYVAAAQAGNALVNSTTTGYGAVWNAPTKNYRVAMSTYPSSNDQILWYSVTNANISAGTNTIAKSMNWDANTGTLTATKFSGPLAGNVTGDVTGNCSGTAANVTGTVAIANGGTGATTRLKGLQALTNENVGTSAQYFLTITSSWGKGGYSSTANAKTVLGVTGSDRRIKDNIEEIPDEVLDAWDNVKWNQFRMKKEVRQKGDEAPLHFGSIVQDVQKALSDGGIDPDRYGFLYHEDYLPEEMNLPSEENPEITNGEKWYLKYAEALSIEAAYLRRRCKRLEESLEDALNRISALEEKGD